jgi:hypothetical protein
MNSRMTRALLGLASLAACSGGGEGELKVQIYGEEYIEAGIPADEFADGWAITFDSFLISVGAVAVAASGAGPAVEETRFQIFDVAADSGGVGQTVAAGAVPTGAYDDTRYIVAPSSDAVAGNASADDVARMTDGGLSVYVAGSATKGDEVKTFAWGFTGRTRYEACESEAVVKAATQASVQLTIHGDHLFYDDLFSETPSVRFDLIAAADGDGDGDITQAELAAVDIRPLANYQVGSTGITNLWDFVEYLTSTLGHIDGEGHCDSEREP